MDCTQLHGRMRQICEGTSGLPPETEQAYRDAWAANPVRPPSLACDYRKEHVGWIDCEACREGSGKTVKFKTFGCELHGICVMRTSVGAVRGCVGCQSRLEPETP